MRLAAWVSLWCMVVLGVKSQLQDPPKPDLDPNMSFLEKHNILKELQSNLTRLGLQPLSRGAAPWPKFPFRVRNPASLLSRPSYLLFTARGDNLNFLQRIYLDLMLSIEKAEAIALIPKSGFKCQGFERSIGSMHMKMEISDAPAPLSLCVSVLLTFSALLYAFDEMELSFDFGYDIGQGSNSSQTVGSVAVWRDGGHLSPFDRVGSQRPAFVETS